MKNANQRAQVINLQEEGSFTDASGDTVYFNY